MGELLDIYDRAGYAVQRASEISAVVISSEQAYVWESGNRDLSYSAEADAFRREEKRLRWKHVSGIWSSMVPIRSI